MVFHAVAVGLAGRFLGPVGSGMPSIAPQVLYASLMVERPPAASLAHVENAEEKTDRLPPAAGAKPEAIAPAPAVVERSTSYAADPGQGTGTSLLPPHYFVLAELDLPPYALHELEIIGPDPLPPEESGQIVLDLWVDSAGSVVKVDVLGTGLSSDAGRMLVDAFLNLPFVPARRQGLAVNSRTQVTVSIAPSGVRGIRNIIRR